MSEYWSRKRLRYPGRALVVSRDKALEMRYTQRMKAALPPHRFACERPIAMTYIGLPDAHKEVCDIASPRHRMWTGERRPGPVTGEVMVPCRKCSNCLAARRRLWTARAIDEIQVAPRSWFGTFTVRPSDRLRVRVLADLASSTHQSSVDDARTFKILAALLGKDVTKMWKRLRKQGARFRYLLVVEKHEDGFPHFHCLLHEEGDPIRKRTLDAAWPLGFSQWRLVDTDPKVAGYVCKYLAKDALTRVRASQSYGQAHKVRHYTEALLSATRLLKDGKQRPSMKPEKNQK